MLRFLYADELKDYPRLASGMFTDRADQFHTRLGWEVNVGADGYEQDEYDAMNPLYVIWETPEGQHGGSMRFLPSTGPIMVNDHFSHLLCGPITSPLIWECTRFCLARSAGPHVAAALMLGGGEIMKGFGIKHFVGVFDARMVRICKRVGSSPEILGTDGEGQAAISVGLWEFDDASQSRLAIRAGIDPALTARWFQRAFGHQPTQDFAKAG
ncbi:autoinducer synthase [Sulfitobacter sp. SK012]|uniref:acyl-homoserine-lactone synthase n=1 Tax=Sulfitobacter sp. SK012 TaxID=1389005 RepID=UPI000E0A8FFF|nr:acyl-homoserine-lactone synthase [Sulfitobacter sp. SK012]AXI47744.1 autoinducer synthase [Sulfitobacter sp. SK012]